MNLEKLKDTARKYEQKEDWRRAIEIYLKAIQQIESGQETSPDLSLYNRVGDLYLKTNDTPAAVRSYERAVDLYADQGFFNNAIALCGKILRVNPGRTQTYLKLAQLHARKNVVIEAKRNLIEFLERMNALGQLDEAFGSVKEFADQFSGSQEIRLMLVELLRASSREEEAREQMEKLAGEIEGRGERHGSRAEQERRPSREVEEPSQTRQASAGLVFLDTGFGLPAAAPPEPSELAPPEGLLLSEPISAEDASAQPQVEAVPGLEQTAEVELDVSSVAPDPELERVEPTELDFIGEPLDVSDAGSADDLIVALPGEPIDASPAGGELELIDSELEPTSSELEPMATEPGSATSELDAVPLMDDEGMAAGAVADGPVVDLTAADEPEADEPAVDDAAAAVPQGDLPLLPVEPAGAPSVVELESEVLDDPDNPELHLQLADRLLQGGEDTRGVEELELALDGFERLGDTTRAAEVVERLVELVPDTIRHHQKRVELAFRSGERGPLLAAYVSLGDALARAGATEKALAVFGRVQEHDPENAHARAALAALRGERDSASERSPEPSAPAVADAAAPPGPAGPAMPPAAATATPARPAAESRSGSGDFIDLGSMIFEEGSTRDTRMRIDRADPKDVDEQKEFQEILEQFKRGIEQNLDTEDYQAHYDLGVAFKEMGLLDEAIAEFQKALRSPEGRLRTSEALGICFYEKGQFGISETVLRRAVETADGGDEAKIGLLYWLGRAAEAQGKEMDAITSYERALAVDIRFMDLSDRMHRLAADRRK
ncbi:MAG TPA: tetratricopeptide repeat protein [Gemmatimonadales bacterium]|nr:tetratricopeptide repeat protein [Gemmatimonadales bacterium]